ncbi:unnamed protein product [Adineta steineri]|uniref:NAD(P)(+)--arginine ADP-ribosyltransferase n=1 Tax=Adineta steineri TaxID=433720 RepID=A0A815DMG4_9BILA|nr:unnamed protein product [Adineta steineri]CAF1299795.1 unnamed protein product [Adineta steineri]CAF3734093.1 unnamed protein product [Adineta steineri]CAF4130038.1 unnamed protein product [Adineta steineri]
MATSITINHRLLESICDEPKTTLVPISGYEKVAVKSLEDACEPIKNLFDHQLKEFITVAKKNCSNLKDNLTQDESASIQLYTMEWAKHDNSLYMKLNETLRLADRSKLKPWFKYLKLFLTAFFKLPPSKDTLVWRGVREDLSALYPKGKEFAWWAFSSCSTSIDVLESKNYLGKSGTRTIFSIQTNSGKLIRAHSYFECEDEILLPPGIYLKVVGSLNSGNGLHIIHLQEIEPPYKMLADPFDLSELKHALPPAKPPSNAVNPQKKEEHSSSASVISKPSVQQSFKKEKPTHTAPKNQSPYSDKKLRCKGRACASCSNCRDWYWHPVGDKKLYGKRNHASCTYNAYGVAADADRGFLYDAFGIGSGEIRRVTIRHLHFIRDAPADFDRLCGCDDNCV